MNSLESVTRRIATVARVLALLAAVDTARAQSGSGSIHGIVNDSTGAPQSGVTVRIQGAETFEEYGGEQFAALPCLNDSPESIAALFGILKRELGGWTDL